jgi:hypothetical protein
MWQRPDGLLWVEVQAAPVDPSGWRLMISLVELDDAPDAPPLVVTVDRHRARVHLLASALHDELGEAIGELDPDHVMALQEAVQRLVAT